MPKQEKSARFEVVEDTDGKKRVHQRMDNTLSLDQVEQRIQRLDDRIAAVQQQRAQLQEQSDELTERRNTLQELHDTADA